MSSQPPPTGRAALVGLFAGVLLAACGSAPGSGSSGIEGLVTAGPSCPNAQQISSCPDQPVAVQIKVLDGSSQEVATISSDRAGHFKVDLAPGTYALQLVSSSSAPGLPPNAAPKTVTVTQGAYAYVHLVFDTGIR